jgi:hypothetical protein
MVNLLIALLVLVLVGLSLGFALIFLRRRRNARNQPELPMYKSQCSKTAHHRRLTISTNRRHDSIYVIDEKRNLVNNSDSPPSSPVPEIRITFPDEEDASGKRTSGRVVVVRITDKGGVGLEPCDEPLPPYQSTGNERFQSLDLERMGGLKEKEEKSRWS